MCCSNQKPSPSQCLDATEPYFVFTLYVQIRSTEKLCSHRHSQIQSDRGSRVICASTCSYGFTLAIKCFHPKQRKSLLLTLHWPKQIPWPCLSSARAGNGILPWPQRGTIWMATLILTTPMITTRKLQDTRGFQCEMEPNTECLDYSRSLNEHFFLS